MRLLLLEDHEPSAKALKQGLARSAVAYEVRHCRTLRAALKLLKTVTFDAALVDLGLPDAYGLDAPVAIKNAVPGLTVVVLTGEDFEPFGEDLIRNGVQDFLQKGETSLTRVDQALRLARERQRQKEHLEYQAAYDSLTGLPNRGEFDRQLQRALCNAERQDTRVAVLALDLDNFKDVNDSRGHCAGDSVLRSAAQQLQRLLRGGDFAARIGGDEFGVILINLRDAAEAKIAAENICQRLADTLRVNGANYPISASIGFSVYPDHGENGGDLLQHADLALYSVKRSGKARARMFSADEMDWESLPADRAGSASR